MNRPITLKQQHIAFLDAAQGKPLIEIAHKFRVKFKLTEVTAGKLIVEWSHLN